MGGVFCVGGLKPRLRIGLIANSKQRYLVVAGPTGSGKSTLALALAKQKNGEIINCDSVQLYRGFDIGSAKASADDRQRVPHHMLDRVEWHEDFDAAMYAKEASEWKNALLARGVLPLVVGGTGLYLRALLGQGWHADLPQDTELREKLAQLDNAALYENLRAVDPKRSDELHPNDRVRLLRSLELVTLLGRPLHLAGLTAAKPADPAAFMIVLDPPRAVLHEKIAKRTATMLDSGLIEEVQGLLSQGVSPNCKPMQSIGYKQVCQYLAGELLLAELPEAIIAATRQYAKRQCTWFRRIRTDLKLTGSESISDVLAALPYF